MKVLFKSSLVCATLFGFVAAANADPQSVAELQSRLEKATQYSADFTQTVRSKKGKELQSGQGNFQVKRPNLFRMDTKTPNENQIISDGKTLWFYDPFVSQVTANWVKDAVSDTPFVLLTANDPAHWAQYDVKQNGDTFVLKPKSKKSALKQFDIRIDAGGLLKGFSTIERDGQSNLYVFRHINTAPISNDVFKFNVPKGVELDDQRKKK